MYRAWSGETGAVGFVRNRDPIFPAYRYLSRAPGVTGVWQVDRPYYKLPGYYYLHRKIPFYDEYTGSGLKRNVETVSSLVSHILSADPGFSVPGYSLEQEFGKVRILRRDQNELPVRLWLDHAPLLVSNRAFCKIRQEAGFIVGKSCCPWERGRPARTRPGRVVAIGFTGWVGSPAD